MNDGIAHYVPAAEIVVQIEELTDGRYVAWAKFPTGGIEDVVTAKNDCRSLHKLFGEIADLYFDSGYLSIHVEQKRRAS